MTYKIGPTFTKPFDSECEAQVNMDVCAGYADEGEQVAFVDDELACPNCLEFATEQNADEKRDRASRIGFRADRQPAADTGEINIIRGRD